MDFAIDNKVPFIIYIGENEVKENKLKVKVKRFNSFLLKKLVFGQ
jgi:threonyl-tRNA synthetase